MIVGVENSSGSKCISWAIVVTIEMSGLVTVVPAICACSSKASATFPSLDIVKPNVVDAVSKL